VEDGREYDVHPREYGEEAVGEWRFILDCHLGRLAKYLRILGFDTLYDNSAEDGALALASREQDRMLLTMDRGLLMRGLVARGCLVRAAAPRAQVLEVVERCGLRPHFRPLRRCLACNGLLRAAEARAVWERIPPRTRAWCEEYWTCADCGHLYWRGSHFDRMAAWVSGLGSSGP
jgi:uncharacterized protein